ncbi:hypothetical protein FRC17_003077 [Serendipita sp. 399]|nr:hypothetical protein FRC17_003077 [Serendipita sp. 399]
MPVTRSSSTSKVPSSTTAAQSSIPAPAVIPKCASPDAFLPSLAPDRPPIEVQEALLKKKRRTLNWEKDERVPRPRNAFIAFKASLRDGPLQREYTARLARGENIGVIAQQMWRALTEKERDVWYAAARKEKEEHAKKYPNYKYQPRTRPRKSYRSKKRSVKEEEDDEESSEEDSFDQDPEQDLEQQPGELTSGSPSSGRSEDEDKEVRTVEIYMGGSQDLEGLYKNGWKWALVKDYEPSSDPLSLDSHKPVIHVPTLVDSEEHKFNPIELISMASAMEKAEAEAATESQLNTCSNTDSSLFQQLFNPWESEPISEPISTTIFEDGTAEEEVSIFSDTILKVQPTD